LIHMEQFVDIFLVEAKVKFKYRIGFNIESTGKIIKYPLSVNEQSYILKILRRCNMDVAA